MTRSDLVVFSVMMALVGATAAGFVPEPWAWPVVSGALWTAVLLLVYRAWDVQGRLGPAAILAAAWARRRFFAWACWVLVSRYAANVLGVCASCFLVGWLLWGELWTPSWAYLVVSGLTITQTTERLQRGR